MIDSLLSNNISQPEIKEEITSVEFASPSQKLKNLKTFLMILGLLLFLVSIVFTLFLIKQRQEIRKEAFAPSVSCPGLMEDVCGPEGYYIGESWDDNTQKLRTWGHYGFNPDDPTKCCPNFGKQRQFYVEILHCQNDDPSKCGYDVATRVAGYCRTLKIEDNGYGCGKGSIDWDFTVDCGRYQVDVCDGGTCQNPKYGYQIFHPCPSASPTPTLTQTPTPTPIPTGTPTLIPSATPTPTPTPQEVSCGWIKAYDTTWGELTSSQLSNLHPGDTVYFAVAGNGPGVFDKARFSINGGAWQETTTQRGETREFYISYTIPEGVRDFEIKGEIHHQTQGWK